MSADPLKLERMLMWFEAQLPAHDVEFRLSLQPARQVLPQQPAFGPRWSQDRVVGSANCPRCQRQWELPAIDNFNCPTRDDVDAAVERAKDWLTRLAAKDGPCWGDVPRVMTQRTDV